MAIQLVPGQVASASLAASVSTATATLPVNPTSGNFVVLLALLLLTNPGTPVVTVQDGGGNVFTPTPSSPFFINRLQWWSGIWYFPNIHNSPNQNITISWTGPAGPTIDTESGVWAAEFSGVALANPLEAEVTQTFTAAGTNITIPSYSSINSGDLYLDTCFTNGTITSTNSPWNQISSILSGDASSYSVQAAAGNLAVNYTQSPATSVGGTLAVFTPPPPPPPEPVAGPFVESEF